MNFTCDKNALQEAVSTANNAISSKVALQVLSNILIETKDNNITATGTDMGMCIRKECEGETKTEGSITVHAKKFIDILKTFPECIIQFLVNKDNTIQINSTELKFGNNIKADFQIRGCLSSEYPEISSADNIKDIENKFCINQNILKKMIKKTISSTSKEDARYFLQGISFEREENSNKLKLVATDGRRLSIITDEVESSTEYSNKFSITVPTKPLSELVKILKNEGTCEITVTRIKVFFKLDNIEISTSLIETDFLEYKNVIPKELPGTIRVNTKTLTDSTKRVSSILDIRDNNKIKFEIRKKSITLYGENPGLGEAKEEIEILSHNGTETDIGLNCNFILDTLRAIDTENSIISFRNEKTPITIREEDNENFLSVLGPMRLE